MENSTGILDRGFEEALQRAADRDRMGYIPYDDESASCLPPTSVERVGEILEQYRRDRKVVDAAVQAARDFLQSPRGVAHVKALEASFGDGAPTNPLSAHIASSISRSEQFNELTSSGNGLQGFGIGVSAGANAVVGAIAGAETIFDFEHDAEFNGRTWYGATFEIDITAFAGLELSFWKEKPLSGAIVGSFVDVAIGALFVRYMHIRQREVGSTKFTYCGWSLQFPLGIAIPIPAMVGAFAAKQKSWTRSKAATLSVTNEDTGVNSIAINTSADLLVTLKNTSGNDTTLSAGATMDINLPSFFSDSDVAGMSIDLSGWTFAVDEGKLTLTLSAETTWKENDEISFEITGVESSAQPSSGDSEIGTVRVTLDTKTDRMLPIHATAEFDLVWANYEATIDWAVTLNSSDDLTLTGDSSGSVTGYAAPGSDIVQLTTATDSSQNTWVLGYIFNYGTDSDGNSAPQVRAVWSKQGAAQVGNNVYYGFYVIGTDGTSTAYYKNQGSASSLAVTVAFDS